MPATRMLLQTTHSRPAAGTRTSPPARVPSSGEARALPLVARAWCALASVSAFWGARAAAARHLRRALRQAAPDPKISLRLGELLAAQERWHEAALVLSEAARRGPVCAETWGNLAFALHRAGRLSAAARALEALAAQTPAPADVLLLRATLLRRLGHTTEALHALRTAATARSAPAGTRFFLGEALLGTSAWQALRAALPPAASLAQAGASDVTVGPRRREAHRPTMTAATVGHTSWSAVLRELPARSAALGQRVAARVAARSQRGARRLLGHVLEHCGRALCTQGSSPLAIRCLRSSQALKTTP